MVSAEELLDPSTLSVVGSSAVVANMSGMGTGRSAGVNGLDKSARLLLFLGVRMALGDWARKRLFSSSVMNGPVFVCCGLVRRALALGGVPRSTRAGRFLTGVDWGL